MDWFNRNNDDGMYGSYAEASRCPICDVPTGAPHMDSCEYAGVWNGPEAAGGEDRNRQRF